MVDLPLMSRLFAALPPESRIILLGDKDQLASVEAGMVLGDICGRGRPQGYSPGLCAALEAVAGVELLPAAGPPIADHLAVLRKSYRFAADSGIGAVARAVNAGDGERAVALLSGAVSADAAMARVTQRQLRGCLAQWIIPRVNTCLAAGGPAEILTAFGRFRVLCAVREGPFGVYAINRLCETLLAEVGIIARGSGAHYAGRPLMVTGNDYALGLFNGDVGMLLKGPGGEAGLRAWFQTPGGLRRLLLPRLPSHETVYAMTVHKAQGSEFDEVLLVLPEEESRALTRELLYTGITRARRRLTLLGSPQRVREAAARPVVRSSGLYDALWSDPILVPDREP
jgi:exodeoxyribonuclease V alpha subunit